MSATEKTTLKNAMTDLITPPPELVREWQREANHNEAMFPQVAALAAQWGADQELEACVNWLDDEDFCIASDQLLAARRPKPPSLKEQALEALQNMDYMNQFPNEHDYNTIRRALEALPND